MCIYIYLCIYIFLPHSFLCSTSWKLPESLQFYFLFLFLPENPSLTTVSTCFQSVMNCFFCEIHCHGFATVTPLLPHNHGLNHFIFIFTLIVFHIQSLDQYLQLVTVKCIAETKMLRTPDSGPKTVILLQKRQFSLLSFQPLGYLRVNFSRISLQSCGLATCLLRN